MKSIFEKYSYKFSEIHRELLKNFFSELDPVMLQRYSNYTTLDSNYPRPLLTLLGMNYMSDSAPELDSCRDQQFLIIPQLVRDVLAIHDDIIDEDLTKFQQDTLPFTFSKIFTPDVTDMNKEGKDFALLFGDYLYPKIYRLILNCSIAPEVKTAVIACVNDVMEGTNIGQIDELLMQHRPLQSCTSDEILQMYQHKAADYCYALPFTLGAIYGGAPEEIIKKTREILLRLGTASQIIDDLMGIFPEALGEAKSTLSDLTCLRRSYLLQLLAERSSDDSELQEILALPFCSEEQALLLKDKIISTGTLDQAVDAVMLNCNSIEKEIDELEVGYYCKFYLKKLVDVRVRSNLDCVLSFFIGNCETSSQS